MSDEFAKLLTENWAAAKAEAKAEVETAKAEVEAAKADAKRDMEQTAMALLKDGMSPDKVAEVTRLSKKDVNRLKASLGATQKSTKKSTKKPTQKSA